MVLFALLAIGCGDDADTASGTKISNDDPFIDTCVEERDDGRTAPCGADLGNGWTFRSDASCDELGAELQGEVVVQVDAVGEYCTVAIDSPDVLKKIGLERCPEGPPTIFAQFLRMAEGWTLTGGGQECAG